jgi:hypothetical protein
MLKPFHAAMETIIYNVFAQIPAAIHVVVMTDKWKIKNDFHVKISMTFHDYNRFSRISRRGF